MRFARVGVDRYVGVQQAFVKAGWSLAKRLTIPKAAETGDQKRLIVEVKASGCVALLDCDLASSEIDAARGVRATARRYSRPCGSS